MSKNNIPNTQKSSASHKTTPVIAIVGRPNVGKSTFFNRVIKEKRAIVEDREGVTRDRNYSFVDTYSIPFILIDTGGIEASSKSQDENFSKSIKEQAVLAIEEADVIIAMFDGNTLSSPDDEEVVRLLRKQNKPCFFVVNKCDGKEQLAKVSEYYSLGVGEIIGISALHGSGVTSLIDEALESLDNYEALNNYRRQLEESQRKAEEDAKIFGLAEEDEEEELEGEFVDESGLRMLSNASWQPRPKISRAEKLITPENAETHPSFSQVFKPSSGEVLSSWKTKQSLFVLPKKADKDELSEDDSENLPEAESHDSSESANTSLADNISVALVGRPNVGKSTLLNLLVGEKRAITSPISGTTRDSLDITIKREGQSYTFVDTAGLRKKARISDEVERFASFRSVSAISKADIVVLLVDAKEGPSEQDASILGLAHDQGRGIVIAVNKWDLLEKDHKTVKEYTIKIKQAFKFAQYAPIVFISALSGKRCPKLVTNINQVYKERNFRVDTSALNKLIDGATKTKSLPTYRGRRIKFLYATQVSVAPPRFLLFLSQPKGLHFSYLRYIKNTIRDRYGFLGNDIKVETRKRGEPKPEK